MKLLPNINLSVPEAADPALIKPVSDALEALDTALGAKLSTLTTTAKTLVGAVNELKADNSLRLPSQAGSVDFGAITAGQYTTLTITFPRAFSTNNVSVVATLNSTTDKRAEISVVSTSSTGCVLAAVPSASVDSLWVHWIAMERD